jgi:protein involved in polysaccharide export with SLBB domain
MEWAAYMQRDYSVRRGDRLSVVVRRIGAGAESDLLQEVTVTPTGTIDLQLLSAPIQVAGSSVAAVRNTLQEAYTAELTAVQVSVSLLEASAQTVYVCGEVRRPGAVPYVPGLTMTQAVAAAGSFEVTVKQEDIRVLRVAPDGTQRTFRVNMESVLLDEQPDFLLLPGDVVYAQTSAIADVGNWVELYIRRLLPFEIGGPAIGTIN